MSEPDRELARELAAEHLERGDATGWFEALYSAAGGSTDSIPWADGEPNPNLVSWLETRQVSELGHKALVVGCGLGDDAQYLAGLGLAVTAFDISPTAIDWCRRRFPDSPVTYRVADLLTPPADFRGAFDFIFEAFTIQALPQQFRSAALENLASLLIPGGLLLVVARARDAHEPPGELPWPLTREDLALLNSEGLETVSFEDYFDEETPPKRRFRVAFRRPV